MDCRELISAAVQAPSSHNTQPWLFRRLEDGIELFADRARALPVNDPFDRELAISCGAALLNLRAAAAAKGIGVRTEICPGTDPDMLARVIAAPDCPVESNLATIVPAIGRRFSTRGELVGEVPEDLCDRLAQAAGCEHSELHFIATEQRGSIAELIAEGDRRQFSNQRWRAELAAWLHPRRKDDGLTQSGLILPITRLVFRHFDLGERVAKNDRELAMEAPLLAVMTTRHDDNHAWVRCGQALQRMLLVASGEGIHAGYLNQPCQVEDLRPRLRMQLASTDHPQLVFRLGYAEEPAHRAPRRDVDEVVIDSLPR